MAFTPKVWKDWPDVTTPRDAAGLIDMETRLSGYTDTVAAALKAGLLTTGVAGSRPTASTAGSGAVYLATDTSEVSRSNGSAWTTIGFMPPDAPVTGSERALYFDFTDTTTFARGWTAAVGTLWTPAGGVVTSPSAGEVVGVRTSESVVDVECVLKMTSPGSLSTGALWSFVARYIDVNNFLMTRVVENAGTWRVEVYKRDGGTYTALSVAPSITAPSTGTAYWVRQRIIGNVITVEWWTTDPAAGGSPAATGSYTLTGGDATKFGAGVRGRVGLRHASTQTWTLDDLIIRPLGRPPRQRDVQVFTSSGTWTKPSGAAADPKAKCRFIGVGHGGPGGSGARRASGVVASGGAGGGGGGVFDFTCDAADAPATATVVYGAAPVAPAGVTTNDTNGSAGTAGGTCFVSSGSWSMTLAARAGSAGAGGQAGATANAGAGGSSQWNGGGGGQASSGSAGAVSGSVAHGASGGGGGGGMGSGPTAFAGGNGSGPLSSSISLIAGGAATGRSRFTPFVQIAPGANGTDGGSVSLTGTFLAAGAKVGCGGAGGGASTSGAGGNGGAGGNYGGGGGGGGCSLNGSASGAGGNGAPAIIVIITEWGG